MTASVQFRAVTKRYGSLIACDGISFDAYAGRVHAIVGENGAGKSTLMKLLAARDRGKAILLVSADLAELFALSDHVAILYRGQIEYEADRSDLEIVRAQRALLGLERTVGA